MGHPSEEYDRATVGSCLVVQLASYLKLITHSDTRTTEPAWCIFQKDAIQHVISP
jgi:hypothetical protein